MEKAKVFVAEDDDMTRQYLKLLLAERGHDVVLEVSTLEEALSAVQGGKLDQFDVNMAIVDGSLSKERPGCGDGRKVTEAIRNSQANITIVAYTSARKQDVDYGDFFISKNESIEVMYGLIASLQST
jgi:CheY-like chemotaxis protein